MTEEEENKAREEETREARRQLAREMAIGFQSIGHFIFEFSQLEFTIRVVVARCFGIDDSLFNIVTGPDDFATLCTVAREALYLKLPEKKEEIDEVLKDCRKLNDERVRVAHGLWTFGAEGIVLQNVSRGSLQARYYFEKRGELDQLADEAQRLMQAVLTIGKRRPVDHSRAAS